MHRVVKWTGNVNREVIPLFVLKESYVWKMYQERCWEFFPAGDCFRKQYEDHLNWFCLEATDSFHTITCWRTSPAILPCLSLIPSSQLPPHSSLRSVCVPNNWLDMKLCSPVQKKHVQSPWEAPTRLSSWLFLIQTINLPSLPKLLAHFVWNASKTLYIQNIRLYAVKYITGGTSRFLAQMILLYIHS